ncbi:MAG TPA: LptA/OstA family protein, partial [Candidatus Wallbacteria bacterium]|nr:LptA/OstA family protein [Candidatus Wallbacteria bacterium]
MRSAFNFKNIRTPLLLAFSAVIMFSSGYVPLAFSQNTAKDKPSNKVTANPETVKAPARKQPVEITGDLLEMEPDNTYVVTGNVRVVQNNRVLTCERGTYNEKSGIVRAFTNVDIVDQKYKMKCQRVDSHMKENYSLFSGGVIIDGDRFLAQSERAFYYEKEEKFMLIGNPVAKSHDKVPNEVRGDRIVYYMKTDRSEVLNNVAAFIQPKNEDPKGSLTHITGNKLEILPDGTYQVLDNLRVIKKDMILYADRGCFDETSEVTEAFGNVKVDTSKYTLTAGHVKHIAKEDRTISNIKPRLIQIIDKKSREKDTSETSVGESSSSESAAKSEKRQPTVADNKAAKNKAPASEEVAVGEKKKISNKDKAILEADEIESLANSTHIIARGKAHLMQFPYLGEETTEGIEISSDVKSEIMDIFTEEGKMIAKQDVVLTSKNITAYGDMATYYEKLDRLDIEGNARALQKRGKGLEDNDIQGDMISYYSATERVIVKGPKIKFFQTSKEEAALPEIEKDTKAVRLKRKKGGTEEVSLGKTGEVNIGKTAEVNMINPITPITPAGSITNTAMPPLP